MEDDVHQSSALHPCVDLRNPRDGLFEKLLVTDYTEEAFVTFGDENVPVPPEGQPPRMGETGNERYDANSRVLRGIEHNRPVWWRHRPNTS
tara:strand:- start:205 stop:477 length:273 start_codon:yes stop_codon:yes gene_type:complete